MVVLASTAIIPPSTRTQPMTHTKTPLRSHTTPAKMGSKEKKMWVRFGQPIPTATLNPLHNLSPRPNLSFIIKHNKFTMSWKAW